MYSELMEDAIAGIRSEEENLELVRFLSICSEGIGDTETYCEYFSRALGGENRDTDSLAVRVKKTADGGVYPVEPSTFVREIPKDLLEEQVLYSNNPDDDGASRRRGDVYGGYGDRYGGRYGDGGRYGGGRYGRGGGTSYTTSWRR